MTHFLNVKEPQNLHELSWAYAQDGKVATDIATGLLVDANPAMEALVGYSRADPAPHFDLHIQRKDGRSVPVAIWSSEKLKLAGRSVVIGEFRDIADQVQREHQLSAQNWALGAYAIAALALGRTHSTQSLLLKAICEAITHQSAYVLAWIGIAEDGRTRRFGLPRRREKPLVIWTG